MLLQKVSYADQVADSLTKSTPKPAFVKHSDDMMGVDSSDDTAVLDVDDTGSDWRGGFTASLPVTRS
eukprot:647868-Rhodomonas_salina.1